MVATVEEKSMGEKTRTLQNLILKLSKTGLEIGRSLAHGAFFMILSSKIFCRYILFIYLVSWPLYLVLIHRRYC